MNAPDITKMQVTRLHLRSLLLLHVDGEYEDRHVARFIAELSAATGVPVVACPAGITLESLNEDEMRAAGWVRAPKEET